MSKTRLASIIGILGVAPIMAASLLVSQSSANHCHSNHSQTANTNVPKTDTRKSVPARSSRSARPSTRVSLPQPDNRHRQFKTPDLEEIYSRDLPTAIQSIDIAARAVESGHTTTAVSELLTARNTLIAMNTVLGEHIKPHFANSHCPIMGSPIEVSKVDESLTRKHKGWKVAFCCAGCPKAWDRLNDAQKQFRVRGVKF